MEENQGTQEVESFAGIEEAGRQITESAEISREARNTAILCHMFGLVGFVGPLMIWLSEKDKDKFVYQHGRSAVNYQLSLVIYFLIGMSLTMLIPRFYWSLAGLFILNVIFVIQGSLRAKAGKPYEYPIAIDFTV